MASYGQTLTLCYLAWDTGNHQGKTGDVANHTLRLVKDGVSAAPTNSPAEVDATNAPGVYSLVLTGAEAAHNAVILCGKSSTSGIVIAPVTVTFEQLPTAQPGATGGVLLVGAAEAAIADKYLGRNIAGGSDGGRTVRDAYRILRNKWDRSNGLTVYQEDDATVAWTATLTVSATASPVTVSDPA